MQRRLTIIISIWTLSECISVLDKGVVSNRISSSQMNDILTNMLSYTFNLEREDRLIIVEPNADIIYHSWAFIRWYNLSADDALHTICAKVGLSDAMLLADRRFADILKEYKESNLLRPRVGFDVINILDDKDIVRLKEVLEHL